MGEEERKEGEREGGERGGGGRERGGGERGRRGGEVTDYSISSVQKWTTLRDDRSEPLPSNPRQPSIN